MIIDISFDRGVVDEEEWEKLGLKDTSAIRTIGLSIEVEDESYNAVATPAEIIINCK